MDFQNKLFMAFAPNMVMIFGGVTGEPVTCIQDGRFNNRGTVYDRVIISYVIPFSVTYEDGSKAEFYARGLAVPKSDIYFRNEIIPKPKNKFSLRIGQKIAQQRAEKAIEWFADESDYDRKDFIENHWDTFSLIQILKREEMGDRELLELEPGRVVKTGETKTL